MKGKQIKSIIKEALSSLKKKKLNEQDVINVGETEPDCNNEELVNEQACQAYVNGNIASLSNVTISNPDGFSNPYFFHLAGCCSQMFPNQTPELGGSGLEGCHPNYLQVFEDGMYGSLATPVNQCQGYINYLNGVYQQGGDNSYYTNEERIEVYNACCPEIGYIIPVPSPNIPDLSTMGGVKPGSDLPTLTPGKGPVKPGTSTTATPMKSKMPMKPGMKPMKPGMKPMMEQPVDTVEGCSNLFAGFDPFFANPSSNPGAPFFAATEEVGIFSSTDYCNGPCVNARHPLYSSTPTTIPNEINGFILDVQALYEWNNSYFCACCDIIAQANIDAADPGLGPVSTGAGPGTSTGGVSVTDLIAKTAKRAKKAPMNKVMEPMKGKMPMKPDMKPMREQVERLQKLANIKKKK